MNDQIQRSNKDHIFQAKKEDDHHNHHHRHLLHNPISYKNPNSSSRHWSSYKNPRIVRVSRAFGGKDRHSKVCTVRGLRDRRIRLSVPTAIQIYDLQDRLGFSQPSKVVDWLIDATQTDIEKLPPLPIIPSIMDQESLPPPPPPPFPNFLSSNYAFKEPSNEGYGGSSYIPQIPPQTLISLNNISNHNQTLNFPNFSYNNFHWDPISGQTDDLRPLGGGGGGGGGSDFYFCPSAAMASFIPSATSSSSSMENSNNNGVNEFRQINLQNPAAAAPFFPTTTLNLINPNPVKSFAHYESSEGRRPLVKGNNGDGKS
ncbi:uncharacterized protein LOC127241684 isoform X2 [Andrographis paniculata]|nr:uncharacterized protein LOC127241684 isoform X2 [Andrographis paniculata]